MLSVRRRAAAEPVLAEAPPGLGGVWPWFNADDGAPLRLEQLHGSVVLLEFWTYICGNCTRTVPLLRDLHAAFGPHDLRVVAVHTPELSADRRAGNVAGAVRELGIRYPVGMDNDYAAWNRWGVDAWPTLFIIDRAGRVRRRHVGEGGQRGLRRAVERLVAE